MFKEVKEENVRDNETFSEVNASGPIYLFADENGSFSPIVNLGDQEGVRMEIIDNQIHAILCYDGVYVEEVDAVLNGNIEYKILEGGGSLSNTILPMISINGMAQLFRFSSYIDPKYIEGMELKDEVCIMLYDISVKMVAAVRYHKMPASYKKRLQEVWDLDKRDILSETRVAALYNKTEMMDINQLWNLIKYKY